MGIIPPLEHFRKPPFFSLGIKGCVNGVRCRSKVDMFVASSSSFFFWIFYCESAFCINLFDFLFWNAHHFSAMFWSLIKPWIISCIGDDGLCLSWRNPGIEMLIDFLDFHQQHWNHLMFDRECLPCCPLYICKKFLPSLTKPCCMGSVYLIPSSLWK